MAHSKRTTYTPETNIISFDGFDRGKDRSTIAIFVVYACMDKKENKFDVAF